MGYSSKNNLESVQYINSRLREIGLYDAMCCASLHTVFKYNKHIIYLNKSILFKYNENLAYYVSIH